MYLTEEKLGIFLNLYFKDLFIHNKAVIESKNKRFRPDYQSKKLKIIIEFDGYSHYCNSKQIKRDNTKDYEYKNLGYKIFRIPYFIQLSNNLIFLIFNDNFNIEQIYPNGFIDSKAILPADFCELGNKKFLNNLDTFYYCKTDIINSLKNKVNELNDINLVLPPSLNYIIK